MARLASRTLARFLALFAALLMCLGGFAPAAAINTTNGVSLGEAVDAPVLSWETYGESAWFGQTSTNHDGVDAARSGLVTDYSGGYSGVRTTVTGPGKLTYWLSVDAYFTHYAVFKIDGVQQDLKCYGQFSWTKFTYDIPAGSHELAWEYHKDSSYSGSYSDSACLDEVSYTGSAITGTMSINSGETSTTSTNVTLDSVVTNADEMRFRNSGGTWGDWETYSTTKAWVLSGGTGTKTVEAEYRNALGGTLSTSDSIEYVISTNILYVNAATGDDITGDGTSGDPFMSVTKATNIAIGTGTVEIIDIAPGTYSTTTTAEVFPIPLVSGVTLRGHGVDVTEIWGTSATIVMRGISATDIALEDLTLSHAGASTTLVLEDGCDASVTDCAMYSGWGISADDSTMMATRVDVSSATGGISSVDSTSTLTGCTFNDLSDRAVFAIRGCATIVDCTAGPDMAAEGFYFLFSDEFLVEKCTVQGGVNSGISAQFSSGTVRETTVTAATNGIFATNCGTVLVDDCDVFGNTSMGVKIESSSEPLLVSNSRFSDNGCGVRAEYASAVVQDSVVTSSTVQAGVSSTYSDVELERCDVYDNTTDGGIYSYSGTLTLKDCDIYDNQTQFKGGGISADNTQLTVDGSRITTNACTNLSGIATGGGIYVEVGDVTIRDSVFSGNTARDAGAFALSDMSDRSTLQMSGCTVADNDAIGGNAGALYLYGTIDATVTATEISRNSGTMVGAINGQLNWGGRLLLEDVDVLDNTSWYWGAIKIDSLEPWRISRSRICGNTGGLTAGLFTNTSGEIENTLVAENVSSASSPPDWGVVSLNAPTASDNVTITACTIVGNTPGGVTSRGAVGTLHVRNSVLWNNREGANPDDVRFPEEDADVQYCTIEEVYPGAGNIYVDPEFADADAADYHLLPGSPAIDAGSPDFTPAYDLDLVTRPQDGDGDGDARCDMGAYESPYFSLEDGNTYANSTLVDAYQSFNGAMQVRYDTGSGFGGWMAYAPTKAIVLPSGEGTKSVTAEFSYFGGLFTKKATDSIILDTTAPSVTDLESPTHPSPTTWYSDDDPSFEWASADSAGISGYSYQLSQTQGATPDTVSEGTTASAAFGDRADGLWYFQVRACDGADNWGDTQELAVRIDTTPPNDPELDSLSHEISTPTRDHTIDITLSGASDAGSGLDGYAVSWSKDASATPMGPKTHSATTAALTSSELGDGSWWVNVSTIDVAGNRTSTSHLGPFPLVSNVEYLSVAGPDRYRTAAEASLEAYPSGADTVVIATGANWPDALGGSALAGAVEGPLLLTRPAALPDAVAAEITRLGAKNAYILGGSAAVSQAVEDSLYKLLSGSVTRLAGSDRYGTANKVADEVIRLEGTLFARSAFVATGNNFPDALGASPLAASSVTPILLARLNGTPYLPEAVDSAVILGGSGAVTPSTESAVRAALGSSNVTRVGGVDRYETAALVAEYGVSGSMRWDGVGIATGMDFPDALSGGAMLGHMDSVMLLTRQSTLAQAARQRLMNNKDNITVVHFIGGTAVVSQAVRDEAAQVLE